MTRVLIYDIESSSPKPDEAIPRIIGWWSTITNEYYWTTDLKVFQKAVDEHKFICGYNNINYDNEVLKRFGVSFKYKIQLDLMQIIHGKGFGNDLGRKSIIQTPDGTHLGNVCHGKSLKETAKALGCSQKMDFEDYDMFKVPFDELDEERQKLGLEYLEYDVLATRDIYLYLEKFFKDFRDGGVVCDETMAELGMGSLNSFLPFCTEEQIAKKQYLTQSVASWTYSAICNMTGMKKQFGEAEHVSYGGGFVGNPLERLMPKKFQTPKRLEEWKQFQDKGAVDGDIYCLDYNCLPSGTQIRMWRDSKQHYDKSIDDVKVGDYVVNHKGKQQIGAVNKTWYEGELIDIELENGMVVSCTPDHKFPLKGGGVKEAQHLTEDDELLTTYSKQTFKNPNYKGKTLKICEVCGSEFEVFKSQEHIKACGKDCSNILRSRNSTKPNLGKTWDSPLKGISRTEEHKKAISKGTKKAMKNVDMKECNKSRDMSFMKDIAWHDKCRLSRLKSVKEGKYTYKGINFRSNWERMTAQMLDKKGIEWQYEPKVFKLADGTHYTPDFYLPASDKWVEVKGYMYDHSRIKIQQFLDEGNDLVMVDSLAKIKDEEIKWLE